MPNLNWDLNLIRSGTILIKKYRESQCFWSLRSYKNDITDLFKKHDSDILNKLEGGEYLRLYNMLVKEIVPTHVTYYIDINDELSGYMTEVRAYMSFLMHKMRGIQNISIDDILSNGLRVSCRIPHTNMMQTLISFRYLEESPFNYVVSRWYILTKEYGVNPSLAFILAHDSNGMDIRNVEINLYSGHSLLYIHNVTKYAIRKWCSTSRAPKDRTALPFFKDNKYGVFNYWYSLDKEDGRTTNAVGSFFNGTHYSDVKKKEEIFLNGK